MRQYTPPSQSPIPGSFDAGPSVRRFRERALLIGVLALQGAFAKHREMLGSLGCPSKEVRTPQELEGCDALILPGGESTVIYRHLERLCMLEPLLRFALNKPLFGTCAGLILLAKTVEDGSINPLGLLDISVERNAYGRQIDSFQGNITFRGNCKTPFGALFIRAPRIRQIGASVQVLGSYQDEPVLIRQGIHLGATFHPELTQDASLHEYFLEIGRNCIYRTTALKESTSLGLLTGL